MQKLQTINAETLLYEPLEKPSFVVDSLIPTGLSLFCGSQKIGKSWLMLKLCLCVSQGIPLWDMPTMEGDVLYLCLEDTFCRIQDRLFRLTDEASGRLHFAVASCKLSDGLIVQLEDYLKDYPDSRLIVIDTLQKVRTASKDNAYASDYGIILFAFFITKSSLKNIYCLFYCNLFIITFYYIGIWTNQPFTAPAIKPFSKYFCTNGYAISIGTEPTTIDANLINSVSLFASA